MRKSRAFFGRGAALAAVCAAVSVSAQQAPNPRQQPGAVVHIYAPEQHDLYDGHFVISAGRIHMVGGFIGCWFLGFFSMTGGMFTDSGGIDQLLTQVVSSLIVAAYSFAVAIVVGLAIEKTIGFRAKEEDEIAGIDLVLHGEGYAI